ncbi:MAG: hypothetical protein J7L30_02975 [Methanophagales archaeon]|nr:hypothetical protein [Methanophagales archaeon]
MEVAEERERGRGKNRIWIKNGIVYDPLNGIEGEKKDIFIENGEIVEELSGKAEKILDVSGKVVLPAGIDAHSHVATFGMNLARFLLKFPTVHEIGVSYAKMGFTHVNEPLATLETACSVHHELASIPFVDASTFTAVSLWDIAKEIREGDFETVRAVFNILADMTKAIGIKIYDSRVHFEKKGFFYRDIDMNTCLRFLQKVSEGEGKREGDTGKGEGVEEHETAENVRMHLRATPAVLEVPFEELRSFRLANISAGVDSEEKYENALKFLCGGGLASIAIPLRTAVCDSCEGTVFIDLGFEKPIVFKRTKPSEVLFALKLALEAVEERGSFALCSAGSIKEFPKVLALLLDRHLREESIGSLASELPSVEFSLSELVLATRANPARLLSLNKGHLGTGAKADIAIYDISEDTKGWELVRGFRECEFLLKYGDFVVFNRKIVRKYCETQTFFKKASPSDWKVKGVGETLRRICDSRSFRRENLCVHECFLKRFNA